MEKTITTYTLLYKIKSIISNALHDQKSFACWSLPGEELIHVITSDDVQKFNPGFQLEDLPEGFVFAPFDQDKRKVFYLKSTFYWNSEEEMDIVDKKEPESQFHKGDSKLYDTPTDHYLHIVEECINKISDGYFEKVVPARKKTNQLQEDFDAIQFFLTLTSQYPDAFVSFVSIPKAGTWIGASPEILIHVKDNIFKTVALAGTQPYEQTRSIRDTSWTQKEIEEQALVSRYVINCFKKIRLREFEEFGPKTVRAGNLLHLKTEFKVDMQETNYPDLGSTMLQLLHPTSAVCGMPVERAQKFLKENEDFDRGFFSGYLGPVNIFNSTDLFVNLRCLQLIDDHIITYAGAGVTIDSDPAKELNETEIKMNTLIRMLK
ncbi:MAG: chorismate-binding protein [Candidatus Cyclobacteriaceae bacterium M2_1C_046]